MFLICILKNIELVTSIDYFTSSLPLWWWRECSQRTEFSSLFLVRCGRCSLGISSCFSFICCYYPLTVASALPMDWVSRVGGEFWSLLVQKQGNRFFFPDCSLLPFFSSALPIHCLGCAEQTGVHGGFLPWNQFFLSYCASVSV